MIGMQKKPLNMMKWEIVDFLFVSVVGTLLHFVYDWTGGNAIAAFFSPINESTWEHLKIFFMPALVFTIIQVACIGKEVPGLITIRAKAVLWGMSFITVFFYTYKGVWGRDVMWLDVLDFYLGAALYSSLIYLRATDEKRNRCTNGSGIAIFLILLAMFLMFTKVQPDIGLFW